MDQGLPHKIRYTETNRKENGKEPQEMGKEENFLDRTPIACALRPQTDKWELIKLQIFWKAKDTINRTKCQPPD